DQRNTEQKPEDDKAAVPAGSSRNRQHVVEAHDEVGNRDDLDSLSKAAACLDVLLTALVGRQQLDGNPGQQSSAEQLQIPDPQQVLDDQREENAHDHRHPGAEDNTCEALFLRQRSARQGNDDGIISGKHNVNADNAQNADDQNGVQTKEILEIIRKLLPQSSRSNE